MDGASRAVKTVSNAKPLVAAKYACQDMNL
jgi:hypothetical protein